MSFKILSSYNETVYVTSFGGCFFLIKLSASTAAQADNPPLVDSNLQSMSLL